MSQHLSFAEHGKAAGGNSQGQKPDPGNPAVRDRREAPGNVSYGELGPRRAIARARVGHPPPKAARARDLSRPCQPKSDSMSGLHGAKRWS